MPRIYKKLSLKQKIFCKRYIQYKGNATQAAFEAYNGSYITCKVLGHQNLKKPHIQAYLRAVMDESGLSVEEIAIYLKNIIQEGVDSKTAEASDAVKAIDLSTKLMDLYPSKKVDLNVNNLNSEAKHINSKELLEKLKKTQEENQFFLTALTNN